MNRNRRSGIKILVFSSIILFFVSLFFVPNTWALDLSRKKKRTERKQIEGIT